MLSIDFETRSRIDLIKCGADVYAADPSTEILCMAYAFDDEPVEIWKRGEHFPFRILDYVDRGGIVAGHNIGGFEIPIWNNIISPPTPLKIEQCVDTMALCYAMALPGALKNAAPAVGLDIEKDAKGGRVMLQLCKPRSNGEFWEYKDSPEKFEILYEYCKRDVEVERALHNRLLELTKSERELWELDWKINRRGVNVATGLVEKCIEIVETEKERLNFKMRELTNNGVATCNAVTQIISWLKSQGVKTPSLAKADLSALLETEIPDVCRSVLLLRREAAKTSTAKLQAMTKGAGSDGRMRGLFQYHGASTGRWAGRRVQLQNLPRPTIEQSDIENIFRILKTKNSEDAAEEIHIFYGYVLQAISDCIRGFLCAPEGKDFISCDFSAIEARVIAWLANEQKVLKIFSGHGKIYEAAAADIYSIPIEEVTKKQRQIGKVAVLALGYGGGVGAFQQLAKGYGVKITDGEAENIKVKWREAHKNIVSYWYALEDAAIEAVRNPGSKFTVGSGCNQITFLKNGSFMWCRLPSGRALCYPYPEINIVTTPWDAEKEALTYMGVDSYTNKWIRIKSYGGKLAENVTQAVARDLLSESLFRLEDKNYPVVMHVHDEVVCEVPNDFGSLKDVEEIMSELPMWAKGLPIAAEGWRGEIFRK